jgi:hypothetical protein
MNHMNMVRLSSGILGSAATDAFAGGLREQELVARRREASATVNSRLVVEDGVPAPTLDSRQGARPLR